MMKKGILCDDVKIWNERNAFFYMENSAGEQYQISRKLYYQLIYVEYTNHIPSEDFPLKWLEKKGFISTHRLIRQSMLMRRLIVAYIGKSGRSLYPICHMINKILPFFALVLLVLGIVASVIKWTPFIWYDAIWTQLMGIVITVAVHELGHLIAYMDYNREREEIVISDVGILLFLFFPIGGYVGVRYSDLLKKKDQIQGLAAGLEMNAATIGAILLCRIVNPYFDIFSPVVLYSVTAIIFNSLPIHGTDGCQILSVLLGVNNIWTTAKATLSDKRRIEKLVRGGIAGWLCLLLFSFQYLLKIIVVLLEIGSTIFLVLMGYYYFSPFN